MIQLLTYYIFYTHYILFTSILQIIIPGLWVTALNVYSMLLLSPSVAPLLLFILKLLLLLLLVCLERGSHYEIIYHSYFWHIKYISFWTVQKNINTNIALNGFHFPLSQNRSYPPAL